jgi:hypothetical protein
MSIGRPLTKERWGVIKHIIDTLRQRRAAKLDIRLTPAELRFIYTRIRSTS